MNWLDFFFGQTSKRQTDDQLKKRKRYSIHKQQDNAIGYLYVAVTQMCLVMMIDLQKKSTNVQWAKIGKKLL